MFRRSGQTHIRICICTCPISYMTRFISLDGQEALNGIHSCVQRFFSFFFLCPGAARERIFLLWTQQIEGPRKKGHAKPQTGKKTSAEPVFFGFTATHLGDSRPLWPSTIILKNERSNQEIREKSMLSKLVSFFEQKKHSAKSTILTSVPSK